MGVPRALSSTGAALMSSAKGNGMRWKPAGSCHPPSSTFSACKSMVGGVSMKDHPPADPWRMI